MRVYEPQRGWMNLRGGPGLTCCGDSGSRCIAPSARDTGNGPAGRERAAAQLGSRLLSQSSAGYCRRRSASLRVPLVLLELPHLFAWRRGRKSARGVAVGWRRLRQLREKRR